MKRPTPQVLPRRTFSLADSKIWHRWILIGITPSNLGLCLKWEVTFPVAAPPLRPRTKSNPSYLVPQVAWDSPAAPQRNLKRLLALRTEMRLPVPSPYPQRITPTSITSNKSINLSGLCSDCLTHPRVSDSIGYQWSPEARPKNSDEICVPDARDSESAPKMSPNRY